MLPGLRFGVRNSVPAEWYIGEERQDFLGVLLFSVFYSTLDAHTPPFQAIFHPSICFILFLAWL